MTSNNKNPQTSKTQERLYQKASPFLTTFPTAMMKFSGLSRKKRSDLSESGKLSQSRKESDLEGPYGLGCLVFSALQCLNNIQFFLILYCGIVMAQGIVFGLVDLSLDSFQKQHHLETTTKLLLISGYDISSCLVALFVAYFGGKGNRTKWIALSCLLVGFGAVLFSIPYMHTEVVKPREDTDEICQTLKPVDACTQRRTIFQSQYIQFFMAGQIIQGVAGMSLYILGLTFIYDSVLMYSAGIYIGLGDAAEIFGYGLGYALGSPQLEHSESHLANETHDSREIKWQMTWWSGFLSVAALSWCITIPMLCFPQSLPGTAKIKAKKDKHLHAFHKKHKHLEKENLLKDMFHAIWILLTNPLFMCQTISKATENLVLIGAAEFLPKYLENQFLLTPSLAAMLTGIIIIPGGAIGHFLGGIIVYKLELASKALMKFTIATSVVTIVLLIFVFFVQCETTKLAGINENYEGSGNIGNLTAPCNVGCHCSTSVYAPICGRDEVEYFSPCFAGCMNYKYRKKETTYYNCSCINQGLTNSDEEGHFIDAISGKCNTKCYTLPLFFAFFFSLVTFSSLCSIPITLFILQIVPNDLHSISIAITYVTLRLFGTIPGPYVFKVTSEVVCTFWETKCEYQDHCWFYNKSQMVYILLGICILGKTGTIILTFFGLHIYDSVIEENSESIQSSVKSRKASKKRKS